MRKAWFRWDCKSDDDDVSHTRPQGRTPFCSLSECREWVRSSPLSFLLSIAHMCQVFLPLQWPRGRRRRNQHTDPFFSRGHWMMNIDATSRMVSANDCNYRWRNRVTWSRSPSELMKVSMSSMQRMDTTNFATHGEGQKSEGVEGQKNILILYKVISELFHVSFSLCVCFIASYF